MEKKQRKTRKDKGKKRDGYRKREKDISVVGNPDSYSQHPSGVECIEITEYMDFCLGNAMKYIWRVDAELQEDTSTVVRKNLDDLKKAIWYIENEIRVLKKVL